jgi:hypothetical protein
MQSNSTGKDNGMQSTNQTGHKHATCLREGGDEGSGEQGLGQLAKVLLEQARNVEAARVRVEGCRLQ